MDDGRWNEFALWRDGVRHALSGGMWLHPFDLRGERWAHLVSSDRAALVRAGELLGLREAWLQYRPLRHPDTGDRVPAWHWDLRGHRLSRAFQLAAPKVPTPRSR